MPQPKTSFPPANDIERRELLGDVERLVQRQRDSAADQPQPGRQRRDLRQKRDLLHRLQRMAL